MTNENEHIPYTPFDFPRHSRELDIGKKRAISTMATDLSGGIEESKKKKIAEMLSEGGQLKSIL